MALARGEKFFKVRMGCEPPPPMHSDCIHSYAEFLSPDAHKLSWEISILMLFKCKIVVIGLSNPAGPFSKAKWTIFYSNDGTRDRKIYINFATSYCKTVIFFWENT